ncbi:MAG: class I SAM-dependent methyltransferase [Clostridium sp.]|nr:class I SAM-dependent methyltransferase [Clostridium sp.]
MMTTMPAMQSLGWTFDTVAAKYEKFRPGYTDDLYKTLFDYIDIDSSSNVVEVGIGGGQATLPILEKGCTLTAVEYGKNFSKLCRKKFEEYKNFSVITEKFENVSFADSQYDLVYSASAFHWIPEEVGYPKVYAMLKKGGAFARFANHPHPAKGNPALSAEIEKLYSTYYYQYYGKEVKSEKEYSKEQAAQRAQIAVRYGFADSRYAMFYRTRTFSAEEYVELLGTYSDHIAVEEGIRTEFFSKIKEAIDRHGGALTIYDTIDLQLARKL